MANQPTKYSKFLVGAASAALVATAVAPVASAADFKDVTKGSTHEEAINALSAAGVISGYTDGTFKPNKTLTRSDVVKMMGKWLVSEGYKVPTDYKTNVRFNDLKSTSNDELLQMAALVKDEGLFIGTPDGKLDPAGDITRENMAVVIVRAFDRVHDIDLASYVAAQDFKKDVTDLGKAKAEARPAIDVLDFFDITNPAAPAFNPKSTTTRGQFATFIYKTLNADFSKVGSGVAAGVASIKAVNATTVEVTMKDKVENINSLNFKIDGLTVSNAAVKQTDDKVVVLTTAVQKGGEKYTVTLNDKAIGSFNGISNVSAKAISLTSTSVQSKVGNQVILTAYVGVKEAGVPVTFNVDAKASLNKDQVFEVLTNAEGIATFSYTQYAHGEDHVAVYPTGNPSVRDFATVYWGVENILKIEEDKAGNAVANGTKKVYTVTYLDPQTGRAVPNATLNVSFLENVDVEYSAIAKATVTDPISGLTKTPYQAKNGQKEFLEIKTDSKGQATFTVSGTNVAVTPFVFVDNKSAVSGNTGNMIFDKEELMQAAAKVSFAGAQINYNLGVTRDGAAEAATGISNGRVYKVKVLDPKNENKPYAGGVVNVGLDELLDRNMSTNSDSKFTNVGTSTSLTLRPGSNGQQATLKLDAKGEASFVLYGEKNDQGTPLVWIDQNTSVNTQAGVLEDGEPFFKGEATYFQASRVMGAKLNGVNKLGKATTEFPKDDYGVFTFDIMNQSGKTIGDYTGKVTFEIRNTGGSDLVLTEIDALVDQDGKEILGTKTIEVGGSLTVVAEIKNGKADLRLDSLSSTTATITAHAVTGNDWTVAGVTEKDSRNFNTAVYAEQVKASFGGAYFPASFTGVVESVNKTTGMVTAFNGTDRYTFSYKDAEYYYLTSSVQSTFAYFESKLSVGDTITFAKAANAESKNKFDIIIDIPSTEANYTALNTAVTASLAAITTAKEGSAVGEYKVGSIAIYNKAVATAKTVADNKDASQAEIDAALATLNAATVEFNKAKNVGEVEFTHTLAVNTPFENTAKLTVSTIADKTPATAKSYVIEYTLVDGTKTVQAYEFDKALTIAIVKGSTINASIQLVDADGKAVGTAKTISLKN